MTSLQAVSPISSYNPLQTIAIASAWNLMKTSLVALGLISQTVPASSSECLDPDLFRNRLTEREESIRSNFNFFGLWDSNEQERGYAYSHDFSLFEFRDEDGHFSYERLGPNSEHLGPCGEQEYFRFRQDDPKGKHLYLFANDLSALTPAHLSLFGREYDVKIKQAVSLGQICQETQKAAKIGKLELLHISIHGSPSSMSIPDAEVTTSDDFSCLSKVDPEGWILLWSCSTGGTNIVNGTEQDNMAQTIANQSGRRVIAPVDNFSDSFTEWKSIRPVALFHPAGKYCDTFRILSNVPEWKRNAFKVFFPNPTCQKTAEVFAQAQEFCNGKWHD